MTTTQFILLATYLLPIYVFSKNLLKFFKQDNLSPEDSFLSLLLLIATILWPLIIPIHCLRFLQNRKPKLQLVHAMPTIVIMVVVGILTIYL